ncbi:yeti isoform X2 [Rhodnius prolixus]|uniref:Craniofacial development protein 1 n=1 Tax=Rhodnius prolixus TaxID=13249 RepID=R4FNN6_RHOPR
MGDRELPSDSDSSDEDFIPQGAENEPASEDESAHDSCEQESSEGEDGDLRKRKKAPSRRKFRKKPKSEDVDKHDEQQKKKETLSAEDRKKKADALWADFLKDCDPPVRKKTESIQNSAGKSGKVAENPAKIKVVEEFHFAGEKVLVEKELTTTKPKSTANGTTNPNCSEPSKPMMAGGRGRGRGGISSILGQIGKKNKLSTLEKSKLDWATFKKDEGIEEDIERHNKGKNGYLERQDFLERADLRQFELEKSLRTSKRSSLR